MTLKFKLVSPNEELDEGFKRRVIFFEAPLATSIPVCGSIGPPVC